MGKLSKDIQNYMLGMLKDNEYDVTSIIDAGINKEEGNKKNCKRNLIKKVM
ncbi:hypothetical protein [Wukongibacter sp. M2B1]|uniref:hypothetical protein n=1 Tax=Wukongibacter sp. M2B1 TaxID=3088895 RepID=UPI003D79909F